MKRYAIQTLAAACLAACAGPVFATAISAASFGNLIITLTDLNPNDGIAPAMSFQAYGRAYVFGETRSWGDSYEKHDFAYYAKQAQNGPLSGSIRDSWATSSASLAAANTLAGFSAMSAGGIAASGADGYGYFRSYATGAEPFLNAFTLSANTRVTFSTQASMHVQTTIGYNLEADMGEVAAASMMFGFQGYTFDGTEQYDIEQHDLRAEFNVRDDGSIEGVNDSWSGLLSSTFTNATAYDASGVFQAYVSAEGISAVTDGVETELAGKAQATVPEPASCALLLGGLAVLWRNKQKYKPTFV